MDKIAGFAGVLLVIIVLSGIVFQNVSVSQETFFIIGIFIFLGVVAMLFGRDPVRHAEEEAEQAVLLEDEITDEDSLPLSNSDPTADPSDSPAQALTKKAKKKKKAIKRTLHIEHEKWQVYTQLKEILRFLSAPPRGATQETMEDAIAKLNIALQSLHVSISQVLTKVNELQDMNKVKQKVIQHGEVKLKTLIKLTSRFEGYLQDLIQYKDVLPHKPLLEKVENILKDPNRLRGGQHIIAKLQEEEKKELQSLVNVQKYLSEFTKLRKNLREQLKIIKGISDCLEKAINGQPKYLKVALNHEARLQKLIEEELFKINSHLRQAYHEEEWTETIANREYKIQWLAKELKILSQKR